MRTTAVAEAVGLSYRQVDYLTRRPHPATTIPGASHTGPGIPRYWYRSTVEQLALAAHLQRSLPTALSEQCNLPAIFDMVATACPDGVTAEGWALWWGSDLFTIVDHPSDLLYDLNDAGTCATVVLRYRMADLLPPEAETHPPLAQRPPAERRQMAMAGADPGQFT